MPDVVDLPFLQARNYTATPGRGIDLIVIHSMETPEKGESAENTAAYFHSTPRRASAHICFDNNSEIRCVHDKDVAYAAPGTNHNGIHLEHAGYARQTAAEWQDPYSYAMLSRSAIIAARYCLAKSLPVKLVNEADLRAGGPRARGITTHWIVTKSGISNNDHTDPGVGFPMDWYLTRVTSVISSIHPPEVVMARIPNLNGCKKNEAGGIYISGQDGGVFCFKGAPMFGNMVGRPMNAPVVDIVPWESSGYWLIGADGGIFGFGAAPGTKPYNPEGPAGLPDEWARGERAVQCAELSWDKKTLTMITDDLNVYDLQVGK